MKNAMMIGIGVVVLLGVLSAGGVFYIVDETEQVVITQFGDPKGDPVTDPDYRSTPDLRAGQRVARLD